MPKNTTEKKEKFFTPRRMAAMAMLIALQIVLARLVGFQISEGLRISIETVPIIIGSLWLGPLSGMIIGFVSDILGTLLSGFGVYFLPLAVTPVLNGLLPYVITHYIFKDKVNVWKCIVTVVVTEMISSLLCGTYALTWYYALYVPAKDNTFSILLAARLTKFATIAADAVLVTALHMAIYKKVIQPMFPERR